MLYFRSVIYLVINDIFLNRIILLNKYSKCAQCKFRFCMEWKSFHRTRWWPHDYWIIWNVYWISLWIPMHMQC